MAGAASCTEVDWRPPSASASAICSASWERLFRQRRDLVVELRGGRLVADGLRRDELADARAELVRLRLQPGGLFLGVREVLRLDRPDGVRRERLGEGLGRLW